MNFALSPQSLNAIRRNISASMTDTFQMMFQMDIFQLPEIGRDENGNMVRAFMDLSYKETRACIMIAITRSLVEHIGDQMAPGGTGTSPEVVQDIVCEITNIVGNHLRSYLSDKMGVEFVISMPKAGVPNAEEPPRIFDLHFRIRENDSINLDFSYTTPDRVAV